MRGREGGRECEREGWREERVSVKGGKERVSVRGEREGDKRRETPTPPSLFNTERRKPSKRTKKHNSLVKTSTGRPSPNRKTQRQKRMPRPTQW